MEKLRVAAIGVGGMGKGHLDSIVANKSVIVKAVCDSNQAALDAVTLPKVRKYSDWRRLLDEEELDLLSVCLPHYLYPPVVIGALGALTISFATVPNEFRVVLHGQESTLDIDSSAMRLYQADKLKKTFTVNDAKTDTLKTQFAHCVKALRSGSPSLCDIEQALEVQTVIEAAYRSDKEKTAIEIKPGPR